MLNLVTSFNLLSAVLLSIFLDVVVLQKFCLQF
jgi:hypothetical protein